MDFRVNPNGSLTITRDPAEVEYLQHLLDRSTHKDRGFLAEMLEYAGWEANGRLFQVAPEDIAALTDAPILTDDLVVLDDGKKEVLGDVWWYPQYELKSFAEKLIADGEVTFAAAPGNRKRETPAATAQRQRG